VMLALAPEHVRSDLISRQVGKADADTIQALIFDRGTTWPWRTDDPRLANEGVIGDAAFATPELGHVIVESVVTQSHAVFMRLLESQKRMR